MTHEPPEILATCEACGGEGSTEEYEAVSRWSIDPPSGFTVLCTRCNGAGFSIEEAEGISC